MKKLLAAVLLSTVLATSVSNPPVLASEVKVQDMDIALRVHPDATWVGIMRDENGEEYYAEYCDRIGTSICKCTGGQGAVNGNCVLCGHSSSVHTGNDGCDHVFDGNYTERTKLMQSRLKVGSGEFVKNILLGDNARTRVYKLKAGGKDVYWLKQW